MTPSGTKGSMSNLRTSLAIAGSLAIVALTGPARADDAPAPPAAPPSPSGPAAPGTGAGGATSAPPKDTTSASAGISEEARRHFKAGVSLLQDPEGEKVEEAYREFRAAYDLSGSPKILGNMGFCAMRLERDGEAIEAYSRYLREVPDIDADERAQIVRDLQTLQVGVVRLAITFDKPGVRVLDERIPVRGARVTNGYGPPANGEKRIEIGVRPGHHVVTAKLAGHEDAVWELEAYAGGKDKFAFTMKEPPAPIAPRASGEEGRSSGPVAPWIVLGTGGALLVAGAVTGVIALGKTNDIESRCPNDVCPRSFDLDDERSSAKTFVRVTDVLLVTGAIAAVGGLTWLLLSGSSDSGKKAGSSRVLTGGSGLRSLPFGVTF